MTDDDSRVMFAWTTTPSQAVVRDGFVLLEEFDGLPDPGGHPADSTVRDSTEAAVASPYLVVGTRVNGAGSSTLRGAVLRYDLTNVSSPVVTILAREGDPGPGGIRGPRQLVSQGLDVLPDGRALLSFTALSGITPEDVVLFDGAVVARADELAPDPTCRRDGRA